jgi:hypothetical protein
VVHSLSHQSFEHVHFQIPWKAINPAVGYTLQEHWHSQVVQHRTPLELPTPIFAYIPSITASSARPDTVCYPAAAATSLCILFDNKTFAIDIVL